MGRKRVYNWINMKVQNSLRHLWIPNILIWGRFPPEVQRWHRRGVEKETSSDKSPCRKLKDSQNPASRFSGLRALPWLWPSVPARKAVEAVRCWSLGPPKTRAPGVAPPAAARWSSLCGMGFAASPVEFCPPHASLLRGKEHTYTPSSWVFLHHFLWIAPIWTLNTE